MKLEHINELMQELMDFVQYELEENGIVPEMKLGKDIPKIEIDAKYLKQALLNIIKNAIGAMPDGGHLKIRTEKDHGMVNISIEDDGTGISEENMSKIFEPYFTTKDFGSGLGLTVVYKVIKEHQGDISINSLEGKGTTFTISLPLPQNERDLIDWQQDGEIIEDDQHEDTELKKIGGDSLHGVEYHVFSSKSSSPGNAEQLDNEQGDIEA